MRKGREIIDRFDLVTETKTVTAQDVLNVRLAPGGGLALRIVPLR
jgi:alpha-glucosidase